jgi:hypothetical protein
MKPLLDNKTFCRWVVRMMIVGAVLLQLAWSLSMRNYSFPRRPMTIQAIKAYQADPTSDAKAAMLAQMRQDALHNEHQDQIRLGLMFLADVVAICFFWNNKTGQPTA